MKNLILIAAAMLISNSAYAGTQAAVHECDVLDRIENLSGNVRTFAQGAIRVAYVSTDEPQFSTDHLLILTPGEFSGSDCFAISRTPGGTGYLSIDMGNLSASPDTSNGLALSVPVNVYDGVKSVPGGVVKFRIRRLNGKYSVTVEN